MISGFSCLRCDLAAIVTGVSVIPYDNLDMVFPVQGAISIISVIALGPIGSASLMVLMIFRFFFDFINKILCFSETGVSSRSVI